MRTNTFSLAIEISQPINMVFSFIFHKKKERDIVGITVYLNKIENLESMSSSSQIAPFVQFHVKEAKSIQKSKVLKRGAGFLFNDVIFLKAKDSTDQLRLEVYDKSNLLSSTLIATGTLLLSSVQQNAKKSFVVDLSPVYIIDLILVWSNSP